MRSKPSKCRVLCHGLLVCTPCCSRGCYGQGEVVVGGPAGSCWALGSGGEPRGESKPKAARGAAGVGELLSGGGSSTLLLGCLIWHGTAEFGMAWHGTAQDGLARFSTPQSPTREMPRARFPHSRPAVGSTGLGSAGKLGGGDPWKCHRCRRPRCPLWQQREGKAAPWDPDPCPGASWGEKAA